MAEPIEYVERLALITVQCHGCKQRMVPSQRVTVDTEAQLHAVALAVHKAAGIICSDPLFALEYQSFLVDSRLAAPVVEAQAADGPT